jgi:hypothetical protein
LAVELANRESRSSWRDFLLGLKARGLHGVEFIVADDLHSDQSRLHPHAGRPETGSFGELSARRRK